MNASHLLPLLFLAMSLVVQPVQAEKEHPRLFPPAPPKPPTCEHEKDAITGEDDDDCTPVVLVCHNPYTRHRKWVWVRLSKLYDWFLKYSMDWQVDGSRFHLNCGYNAVLPSIKSNSPDMSASGDPPWMP